MHIGSLLKKIHNNKQEKQIDTILSHVLVIYCCLQEHSDFIYMALHAFLHSG